jgi:hypothetical protein
MELTLRFHGVPASGITDATIVARRFVERATERVAPVAYSAHDVEVIVSDAERLERKRCIAIVEAEQGEYEPGREAWNVLGDVLAGLRAESPNPPTAKLSRCERCGSFCAMCGKVNEVVLPMADDESPNQPTDRPWTRCVECDGSGLDDDAECSMCNGVGSRPPSETGSVSDPQLREGATPSAG